MINFLSLSLLVFALPVTIGVECPDCGLVLLQNGATQVRGPIWERGSCSDTWRKFGSQPLTTTQVVGKRHGAIPKPDDDIFVDPTNKFAFCRIAKVGSTQWNVQLKKVLDNNDKVGGGFDKNSVESVYNVPQHSLKRYGKAAVKQVFLDSSATRAVVVRDPIQRFASAFLDKCFSHACGSSHCHLRKKHGTAVSMSDAVEWAIGLGKEFYTIQDTHWRLQSEHCNLKETVRQFDIITLFDKEHVSKDAACIMEKAGLERFNVPTSRDSGAKTFWEESRTKKHKARGGTELGYSGPGQHGEEDVMKKLFTKKAALKLREFLQQDYDTFHFPTPSWIEEATGEWYEEKPDTLCKIENKKGKHDNGASLIKEDAAESAMSATDFAEEDDVYVLARMARYFQ